MVRQRKLSGAVQIDEKNMQTLRDLVATHATIRYGVLLPSVHQTVRDHTNRMLALAPVVADIVHIDCDYNRLNALILAHDLSELGMQRDVTITEQVTKEGAKARKEELEGRKRTDLAQGYGEWLKDLFDEFEQQASEPARFVKWLDKYEASRHMLEVSAYSRINHQTDQEYIPFYLNTIRLVTAARCMPSLKEFTLAHLERELRPVFIRDGHEDKCAELLAML